MAASLSEIARIAGVSPSTVSRFVRGELNVRGETAEKIQEAMSQVGWQAPTLTNTSLRTIALIIPNLTNPFFAKLGAEVISAGDAAQKTVAVLVSGGRIDNEIELIEEALANPTVDAIILVGNNSLDGDINSASLTKPFVMLDEMVLNVDASLENSALGYTNIRPSSIPYVVADNANGAYQATNHLLAFGHRRVAFIGGPDGLLSAHQRELGYRKAITFHGLEVDERYIFHGPYSEAFGASTLPRLLTAPDPVTAVFASSDVVAIGLIRAAEQCGLHIPDDLSVIGFDSISLCDWIHPGLSSVQQPIADMAQAALRAIVDTAAGHAPSGHIFPMHVVTRASVKRIG